MCIRARADAGRSRQQTAGKASSVVQTTAAEAASVRGVSAAVVTGANQQQQQRPMDTSTPAQPTVSVRFTVVDS